MSKITRALGIAVAVALLPAVFTMVSFANTIQVSTVPTGNTTLPDSGGSGPLIYSTMGTPGSYTYNAGAGYTTTGASLGTIIGASEFTSSGNFSLSEIDVAIGYESGTNSADISIWTDVSGAPGTQVGSTFQVTGLTDLGNCCSVASVTGISGINLTAGTNYFIVVGPGASDTWVAWNLANTATGLFDQQAGGVWGQYPGSPLGSFALIATPEPGTLVLLALGLSLLGFIGVIRRKRRLPC